MKKAGKFLLSPWAILIGMVIGAVIGIYFKSAVPHIKPVGDVYENTADERNSNHGFCHCDKYRNYDEIQ